MRLGNATFLAALFLGSLVYAAENIPPNPVATIAVSAKAPPPVVEPPKCAQETWPNITPDCLRHGDSERPPGDVRVIVAERP